MSRNVLSLTVVVLAMGLLSACAVPPAGKAATPTPVTTSETAVPTEQATDQGTIVTLADQGKTINMTVGQRFLLKLGADYTWNITISDENVISQVPNIPLVFGAQGIYNANAAGTATLTAAGDPTCLQSTPACATPSIQFSITVVVT